MQGPGPADAALAWAAVRARYRPLVPFVRHRADRTYLLDQLGGELSVGQIVGALGVLLEWEAAPGRRPQEALDLLEQTRSLLIDGFLEVAAEDPHEDVVADTGEEVPDDRAGTRSAPTGSDGEMGG